MEETITAYATMFDKDFVYYGGTLDRLAIFKTKKHAEAYGEMFTKKNFTVKKVEITLTQ